VKEKQEREDVREKFQDLYKFDDEAKTLREANKY
jgi:hypothetical protein